MRRAIAARASTSSRAGVVLDTGAFNALERRNPTMVELVRRFAEKDTPLATSAGVVAQVWRGGGLSQVPVVFLLRRTTVVDLTHAVARVLGKMLAATSTSDPIDAHVVLLARERHWPVISSDPDDLARLDPTLRIERI